MLDPKWTAAVLVGRRSGMWVSEWLVWLATSKYVLGAIRFVVDFLLP